MAAAEKLLCDCGAQLVWPMPGVDTICRCGSVWTFVPGAQLGAQHAPKAADRPRHMREYTARLEIAARHPAVPGATAVDVTLTAASDDEATAELDRIAAALGPVVWGQIVVDDAEWYG